MRIRSIKPGFWRSDDVDRMDWHTRLVFIGLWSYVDDNGVGRDRVSDVAADLFSGDLSRDASDTLARVAAGLDALAAGGQITRYEVDGRRYLHVTAWNTHQRVDNASKLQRYPLPDADGAVTSGDAPPPPISRESVATPSRESREGRGDSPLGEGEKGRRGEGEKTPRKRATQLPADFAVTDAMREWAGTTVPGVDVDLATTKFVNHATANGRTLKDWTAGWRNWLLNERPDPSRPAPLRLVQPEDITAESITDEQLDDLLGPDREVPSGWPEDLTPRTPAFDAWIAQWQANRRRERVGQAMTRLARRARAGA